MPKNHKKYEMLEQREEEQYLNFLEEFYNELEAWGQEQLPVAA